MKIVCDNCAAKYSIADEKVAGKVFKIRCKKCSHVLEVRGDENQPDEEATQIYDYGTESVWYVVIEGEQQGPMTPMQLGALFAKGEITKGSYVWREGFADWKPAAQVPELVEYVVPDGAHRGEPTAELDLSKERVVGGANGQQSIADSSGDLFGDVSEPSPSPDVFAPAASAAAAPEAGASPAMATAAAQPAAARPMTGQRNENSVLFSLSNLQQLASEEGNHAVASEPAPSPFLSASRSQPAARSAPVEEGSGLIDIRALAKASTTTHSSPTAGAGDDLLSIARNSFRSPSLGGSSVLAPNLDEDYKKERWLKFGIIGALGLIAILIVVLIAYIARPDEKIVVGVPTAASSPPAPAQAAPAPPPPVAQPVAVAEPEPPAPVEPPPEEPAAEPAPTIAAPTVSSAKKRSTSTRSSRSSRSSSRSKPSSSTRSTASSSTSSSSSKSASLDSLMDEVVGKSASSSSKSSSSSSSTSGLPNTPDRSDVKQALSGVSGAVKSCKEGSSGTATVDVTFAGSTGRVQSAKVVSGPFKGTSVGTCIANAVKPARVPKFKQSSFNVKFPYRL